MASMNNWLGFSLSPHHHYQLPSHAHENISSATDEGCFDLTSADTSVVPSLNQLPPPYGILEAFNRGDNQPQEWNLKGGSELSMLIGSSCSTTTHHRHEEPPKLENFLGSSQCFRAENAASCSSTTAPYNHHSIGLTAQTNGGVSGGGGVVDYNNMFTNSTTTTTTTTSNNNNSNGINVSMIKTWLRNQPSAGKIKDGGGVVGGGRGGGGLSLSMMSTGSHEPALPLLTAVSGGGGGGGGGGGESEGSLSNYENNNNNNNKMVDESGTTSSGGGGVVVADASSGAVDGCVSTPRKSIDTFGQRTSIYRGVTRHRWTGRYEAHLWDNSCRREGQTRKGRQVYLGGYDKEEKAARAYDLAAIKYWGTTTTTNFPISDYEKEVEEMKHMTRQEYVASLRRKSSGFSRGASIYRGVTRHHQHGRWQARIGRVAGNKDLYLGTFSTQEEAAEAYDIAAIKFRGLNAVTNFEISRYDVKTILDSTTLPIGAAAKRQSKLDVEHLTAAAAATFGHHAIQSTADADDDDNNHPIFSSSIQLAAAAAAGYHSNYWPAGIAFQPQAAHPLPHYAYGGGGGGCGGGTGLQQRFVSWCKQEPEPDSSGNHHHHRHDHDAAGHNFFHYNLMGFDTSSLGHQNSVMYNAAASCGGDNGGAVIGYGSSSGGGGGYGLPVPTDHVGHQGTSEPGFGENDGNLYYQQQSSSENNGVGVIKAVNSGYSQPAGSGGGCIINGWNIPTAVPAAALASRSTNNLALCHGPASTFTVWNDS